MSDLEDAAAALAQQRRVDAEAAARHSEQGARQQSETPLRALAREFFDLALKHGAPTLPLYLYGSPSHDGAYARLDVPCITASRITVRASDHQWAVTSDGAIYHYARITERRHIWDAPLLGIRDDIFVVVDMRNQDTVSNSHEWMRPRFIATVAALLAPTPMWDRDRGRQVLSGIQKDGLISYEL